MFDSELSQIAILRDVVLKSKNGIKEVQEQLDETELGKELTKRSQHLRDTQDSLAMIENNFRSSVEIAYIADDRVELPQFVKIQKRTKLEYPEAEALKWAVDSKLGNLLKLNKKGFEAFAKAYDVPFVSIKQKPTVTIATNLSSLLPTEE